MIDLASGDNVITVTAFDSSGNSATATLTVNLGAPVAGAAGRKKDESGMCGVGSVSGSAAGLWLLVAALLLYTPTRRQ
jgi:hypothetical protein